MLPLCGMITSLTDEETEAQKKKKKVISLGSRILVFDSELVVPLAFSCSHHSGDKGLLIKSKREKTLQRTKKRL